MRTSLVLVFLASLGWSPLHARPDRPETPYPVKVSDNHRFLIDQHGKPFIYLGDTAWELFHRLDRDEAELYLKDRAFKKFNVIQAVVLAELSGLDVPNANGDLPLMGKDPTKPNEAYFQHVDFIVNRADEMGMVVGMLPTWGAWWKDEQSIFNPESARAYGEFLGKRYKNKPIIWVLGGDRGIGKPVETAIIRAMAEGLKKSDGGRHLMTFHPPGGNSSSNWFHGDDWLDFNMAQTGHDYDRDNYARIAEDYHREPTKPCLDGEPGYEDHPAGFNKANGYMNADDVRKFAYWSLFAGACGHTYGCHDIWQFYQPGREPLTAARTPWREALKLPGSGQMQHARALIESRPILKRVPDQSLIASEIGDRADHVQATRADDGSYAFVYAPTGKPVTVDLGKLSGDELDAAWYDPRTGESTPIGKVKREGRREFRPPSQGKGKDWVLVLDDASKGFGRPGATPANVVGARGRPTNPAGDAEPMDQRLAGHRLAVATFRTGDTEIFLVDPETGDARNLTRSPSSSERYPAFSPDGSLVSFNSDRDGEFNLYVIGSDGKNLRQLTHGKKGIVTGMQSWTADGRWIYFGLFGKGAPLMCRIAPDGSNYEEVGVGIDPAVSPDGMTIVYAKQEPGGHFLYAMGSDGKNERRITEKGNPWAGVHAAWSPDGHFMVYADQVGDALELFRRDADGSNPKQLTSFGQAANSPCVSTDNKWISFRLCDEIYWRDGKTSERAYKERRADKRPVWVMGIDGSAPHVIEPLHYQTTIDGSRAAWSRAK